MRRFLKSAMVVVAALGLLSFAGPAGASSSTGTITAGTLSINLTPVLTTTLGPGGTGATCEGPSGLTITETTSNTNTGTSGTVGGTWSLHFSSGFQYNGGWYEIRSLTVAGTWASVHQNGTAPTSSPNSSWAITSSGSTAATTGGATGQIITTTATNPCSSTGTVVATVVGVSSFNVTSTANNGSLTSVHPHVLGTIDDIDGAGHVSCFGCGAPFSALNSKTATVSNSAVILT